MKTRAVQVAIIEPEAPDDALQLPRVARAQVVMRASLAPADLDRLEQLGVSVAVLDLRKTCTTEIGAVMRLIRMSAPQVRVVAVTEPGDDAAAQFCIATGAVAHLGQNLNPLTLLGAVMSASRGAPSLGETGKRAIRRMNFDNEL
jgi:CheY-like chemotaxis protein